MRSDANILVTGGAGFIGSNFVRYALGLPSLRGRIINLDNLTYAGNKANLGGFGPRHVFVKGDIRDTRLALRLLKKYSVSHIVNFAAESHVDRSILAPAEFILTNINGTFSLLEAARAAWGARRDVRFHHVGTDEVYGSLGRTGKFKETTPYAPRSPYSASKAASDHLVMAYYHTYGLPVTISNCSNNYGPCQFPEKLIPLTIINALQGKKLPVYGDGLQVRDWLYVEDHCAAVWRVLGKGRVGQTYNVGGGCELRNLDVVKAVCAELERRAPAAANTAMKGRKYSSLITHISDRPGHDRRYAMDFSKIHRQLGWKPAVSFCDGLARTVAWYLASGAPRGWLKRKSAG